MAVHAGRVTWKAPKTWVRKTRSTSSPVIDSKGRRGSPMPALCTSTSRRPHVSRAVATMAAASSASDTSWTSGTASPPAARISPVTSEAGSGEPPLPSHSTPLSLTTTFAPRSASSRAYARPRPRPAPVTTATRPSKRTSPIGPLCP